MIVSWKFTALLFWILSMGNYEKFIPLSRIQWTESQNFEDPRFSKILVLVKYRVN
jgi:hypothetical protein